VELLIVRFPSFAWEYIVFLVGFRSTFVWRRHATTLPTSIKRTNTAATNIIDFLRILSCSIRDFGVRIFDIDVPYPVNHRAKSFMLPREFGDLQTVVVQSHPGWPTCSSLVATSTSTPPAGATADR
jgi:hypothetical protein